MLQLFILSYLWVFCSAFQDPSSYSSSFMHGEKPILRIGLDNNEQNGQAVQSAPTTTGPPKEPEWVTMLRNNIISVIKRKGFNNAKGTIKEMIAEADENVNKKKLYQQGDPSEGLSPLRALVDDISKPEESAYKVRSRFEAEWEKDLKKYIKGLIGLYGKKHLDGYVTPVVKALEEKNNIAIKDIDGEITINWSTKKNLNLGVYPDMNPMPSPFVMQRNEYATMMPSEYDP